MMRGKTGVIITGGDFQALGAARTFARKGIPVILLDHDWCIGRYSNMKTAFYKSPPVSDQEAYLGFLTDLSRKQQVHGWVILPNSDEGVFLLSKNKKILEGIFRVPTPDWNVIEKVYVKKSTYQLASRHGIPTPRTWYPKDIRELMDLDVTYPLIIKPSIRDHFYTKTKKKALLIKSRADLEKTYDAVTHVIDASEVLIQDYVPGGPQNLYSCCPFFKNGRILASITARRTRQHPMDFGHASTFVEMVDVPELTPITERFLALIDYYGICEVEFMQDPRDRTYKMIEVNPRLWGWHSLAIAAGVDLPYLLYQDMLGEEIALPGAGKNIKWVRMTTDVPTVVSEMLKGRLGVREYVSSMKGEKEFSVYSSKDPLPCLMELAMVPYLWLKRGR